MLKITPEEVQERRFQFSDKKHSISHIEFCPDCHVILENWFEVNSYKKDEQMIKQILCKKHKYIKYNLFGRLEFRCKYCNYEGRHSYEYKKIKKEKEDVLRNYRMIGHGLTLEQFINSTGFCGEIKTYATYRCPKCFSIFVL